MLIFLLALITDVINNLFIKLMKFFLLMNKTWTTNKIFSSSWGEELWTVRIWNKAFLFIQIMKTGLISVSQKTKVLKLKWACNILKLFIIEIIFGMKNCKQSFTFLLYILWLMMDDYKCYAYDEENYICRIFS